MNRLVRALLAILFLAIIVFSAISICQRLGRGVRMDITEEKLYTLSDGTKNIIGKLNQPVSMTLYYAKTAAMKAPDQIQFYNSYYNYVNELLQEYAAQSKGMIEYEVIDPRPFSDDEEKALQAGLQRFPITENESFFFGLILQTPFGVIKTIPFFSPDRQNFIEYDISYLIDTAITRDKRRIGVMSSLEVMGDDVSGYMAQMMRMQGKQPKPAWGIVNQLKEQYEVVTVGTDVDEISDVDLLMVIHPKDLPESAQFAIDQFVLKGGRTMVFVDPHCMEDQPEQQQQMMQQQQHSSASGLNTLLRAWGVEMVDDTFAGDRELAIKTPIRQNSMPETLIGFLGLTNKVMNSEQSITANLGDVKMLFAGALRKVDGVDSEFVPLVQTTDRGNTWSVSSPYQIMMMDAKGMMSQFTPGSKPVTMGALVTGTFTSAFPEGVTVAVDAEEGAADPCSTEPTTKQLTGLTEAADTCMVAVFSDVDFISDMLAFRDSFLGKMVVGDNSALVMNAIEDMSGSSDLIMVRSRGSFKRPFTVVDEIEAEAEARYDEKVQNIQARIQTFESELQQILAGSENQDQALIESSVLAKRDELQKQLREAKKELRMTNMAKREDIEALGNRLRAINMLAAPAVILLIAIVLGIYRGLKRRHSINHLATNKA